MQKKRERGNHEAGEGTKKKNRGCKTRSRSRREHG